MTLQSIPVLLASLLVVAPMNAFGSPITITVSGSVASIQDPANWLGTSVEVGSKFNTTFTLDSTRADSRPGDSSIGIFSSRFAPYGAEGEVGDLPLVDNGAELVLNNDVPVSFEGVTTTGDTLTLSFRDLTIPGVHCVLEGPLAGPCHVFSINFIDPTATALASDQMPIDFPDLSAWATTSMTMGMLHLPIGHPSSLIVGGTVEQFVVVPEPSTACLVTVGLLAFVAGRKGAKRVGLRAVRDAGHDRPTGKG